MSNGEESPRTPNSEANAAGGASIASREPSGVEIAKGWLALLEPDAYLIPPPTITRKQLLTVARTLVVLHEFAEKYATHTDPFGRPSIEPVSETSTRFQWKEIPWALPFEPVNETYVIPRSINRVVTYIGNERAFAFDLPPKPEEPKHE